jgi:DNA helicase-2/ATP-dependent DNA helicase PcrA
MLYGRTNATMPSRFLREIPESVVEKKGGYYSHAPQTSYSQRTPLSAAYDRTPKSSNSTTYTLPPKSSTYLDLNRGDMVQHTAFGKGMVLSVVKTSGDALLEIAFDKIGTKRLMAKTASAHMKKLS